MATDDTPDTPTTPAEGETAVAAPEGPIKLPQQVEITDAGPCKKHVKVTVDRAAIDGRIDEKFTDLMVEDPAQVPGFRPGKAPRKIVERKFAKEVAGEVKTEVLMASLEQLAEENMLSPLSPPELDPGRDRDPRGGADRLRVRRRGPARVRPARLQGAEAPPADPHLHRRRGRAKEARRLLEPYGQIVPKDGSRSPWTTSSPPTWSSRVRTARSSTRSPRSGSGSRSGWPCPTAWPRSSASRSAGAKPGDTRTVDITLSQDVANRSPAGDEGQGRRSPSRT